MKLNNQRKFKESELLDVDSIEDVSYLDIFNKLEKLNQFIKLSETRLLNVINGCEVNFNGSSITGAFVSNSQTPETEERIYLKWDLGEIKTKEKGLSWHNKLYRLEASNAKKYLTAMESQSRTLD